jgi:hypothetical protein
MPDGREPLTPSLPTTVTCPSCGVDVAVGYPRCPRCHAAVPQAPRARRQTFRESNVAGGTSLEPPIGAGGRGGLLLLVLGGVAALLLVIYLATRGGDEPKAAAQDEVEEEETDEEEDEAEQGGAPDEGEAVEEEEGEAEDLMPSALRDLDEALRAAQMWSKVTREDDVVVVESSLCEDGGMWSAIAPLAAQLRDAGASAVRCRAQHGAVVFERKL